MDIEDFMADRRPPPSAGNRGLNPGIQPGALDTQSIAINQFWQFARQGMRIAIGLHLAFAIAGLLAGAMPLVYLQIVTVAVYACCYFASSRGYRNVAIALTWFDLMGHSTIACLIVGVGNGFQYYSWILLPLLFTNVHRSLRSKVVMAGALSIMYVVLDWWLSHTTPMIVVDPIALAGLRYFNIGCYFLALGILSVAHMRTVREAEQRLNMFASTDALTGLLNRRRMSDHLQMALVRARDDGRALAVIVLDIDHFKSINDRYGHGRGDQVIAQVGRILSESVREHDLVARWGGEEFLVLLPGADAAAASETAERVRRAIILNLARDQSDQTPVTVTMGVAAWDRGESLEHTIDRADNALYAGKQAGRNRVVVDEPAGQEEWQEVG
jgi:diguanylate cyclase (GGDEF)-like protein